MTSGQTTVVIVLLGAIVGELFTITITIARILGKM